MSDLSRPAARQRDHRWLVLGVLGMAQLMVVLDATIVNIALPSAQRALGFSIADRQWIITAYSLAFGGLLLLGGRLSDLFGRKRTFLVGLVGFAVASAIGGAATGFTMLVAARAVQGGFGAVLAPSALSLLTTTFSDPSERGKAFGIFGAIAGAGGAIGLLLGGVLTEYLDWRYCLYVNVVIAVVAVVGATLLLGDERPDVRPHLDIPGTIVVIAGLAALVYGFSEAEMSSWGDPLTVGMIIAAAVLLAAFVVIERRVAHPLLPLRVVLDRSRGGSYLAIGLAGISVFGVFLFLTYFLQETRHFSPVRTGLGFLPMVASLMLASTLTTTKILPRIGPRPIVVFGGLAGAGGMLVLAQLTPTTSYLTGVVPGLILIGLGIGSVFGSSFNTATAGVREDAGVASAMVSASQQVGGSIGTALLNTIAASAATSYLAGRIPATALAARASVHGDTTAFMVSMAILLGAALVCGVVLPGGRPAARVGEEPALVAA